MARSLNRIWVRFGLWIAATVLSTMALLSACAWGFFNWQYSHFYQALPDAVRVELDDLTARDLENENIQKEQMIERAKVEQRKTVELAEQDRAIAVAEKSRAESEAKAQADRARAEAVKAEEEVVTVRETQRAERIKAVELVNAAQEAQKEALALTVAAEAEKQAALDKAEAVRIGAEAEAEKCRLQAKGEADAKILLAQAQEQQYKVDAEGARAVNEAANVLSVAQVEMQVRMALLRHLPDIIRESVKPMENIDDIKILQVSGLNGLAGGVMGGGWRGWFAPRRFFVRSGGKQCVALPLTCTFNRQLDG